MHFLKKKKKKIYFVDAAAARRALTLRTLRYEAAPFFQSSGRGSMQGEGKRNVGDTLCTRRGYGIRNASPTTAPLFCHRGRLRFAAVLAAPQRQERMGQTSVLPQRATLPS